MKGISRLLLSVFVIGFALTALVACGGGGSDSGVTYTGVSTQAVIDDTNAQQLVVDAYNGGNLSDSLVIPLSADSTPSLALVPLSTLLADSMPPLDFAPTVHAQTTEQLVGSCGGTATVTVSEGTTSASGTVVYNSYCDAGVTVNGSLSFSASYNTQTGIVSMTMHFGNLTTAEGSLYGTASMTYDFSDATASMTMGLNIIVTDALEQTYWIKNYTIVITPGTTYDSAEVSGTYYDFERGYVVISTTSPLLVDNVTGVPESGTIHFVGAEGTYADLVATGGGTYTLTVSTGTVINGTF